MGHLGRLFRQCGVVVLNRPLRVERQRKLVVPAEFEARLAHRIVAHLCTGVPLGQIRCMGRHLVGDDPFAHIFFIGQPQVLFRGHIAEHGGTVPADHRCTNGRAEMVVTRGDIGHQWTESVERRLTTLLELLLHVDLDHLHRHMTRPFNDGLHVVLPRHLGQFAQRLQFTELCCIIGIRQ